MEYILPVGILLVMIFGVILAAYKDNKKWNDGSCTQCVSGHWKKFDTDSSGCAGYKCNNCDARFWESGWIDHSKKSNG